MSQLLIYVLTFSIFSIVKPYTYTKNSSVTLSSEENMVTWAPCLRLVTFNNSNNYTLEKYATSENIVKIRGIRIMRRLQYHESIYKLNIPKLNPILGVVQLINVVK